MRPSTPSNENNNNEKIPSGKILGLSSNGILCLYNQFPRCYRDINEMTKQLPAIAAMGFNAVWINPIQAVGQIQFSKFLNHEEGMRAVKGSLYAMAETKQIDNAFSVAKINSALNEENIEALIRYTATAREYGLMPIFDLVLNHLAVDSPIVASNAKWFDKNRSSFDKDVIDFNFAAYDQSSWQEVLKFWKEYITLYIKTFGFMGVRVDAVKLIPIKLQRELYQHIDSLCNELYRVKPIILAEVFLTNSDKLQVISEQLKNLGITHVNNCLHWERFTRDYRSSEENSGYSRWERWWNKNNNTLTQTWYFRQIVRGENGNLLGGTIGFSGCHDTASLFDAALTAQAKSTVERREGYNYPICDYFTKVENELVKIKKNTPEDINSYLKEMIAAIAFTSDAGWYLLSGDEFGHPGRKWVFDFYKPFEKEGDFRKGWGGQFDLRNFICTVNSTLKRLAKPTANFWAQHVVLNNKPELMIVIRHNKVDYYEIPELIINLSIREIIFTKTDLEKIAINASQRSYENAAVQARARHCVLAVEQEQKIFCLGNIKIIGLRGVISINKNIDENKSTQKQIANLVASQTLYKKPDKNLILTYLIQEAQILRERDSVKLIYSRRDLAEQLESMLKKLSINKFQFRSEGSDNNNNNNNNDREKYIFYLTDKEYQIVTDNMLKSNKTDTSKPIIVSSSNIPVSTASISTQLTTSFITQEEFSKDQIAEIENYINKLRKQ